MAGEVVFPQQLDLMEPDQLRLHSPVLRDILQVNATSMDGMALLEITKTDIDLSIVRVDGHDIQVNVKYQDAIPGPPGFRLLSELVFAEPTPKVELARYPLHPYSWQMGPNMPACINIEAAALFLSTVGMYGRIKQAKLRVENPGI
jgi:hypothetical protein